MHANVEVQLALINWSDLDRDEAIFALLNPDLDAGDLGEFGRIVFEIALRQYGNGPIGALHATEMADDQRHPWVLTSPGDGDAQPRLFQLRHQGSPHPICIRLL